MSYCRMSDDCDVYAYKFIGGGFEIHVRPIDKEYDNEHLFVSTHEEFLNCMNKLRDAGYRIPDRTFERIHREMKAADEWYEFDP